MAQSIDDINTIINFPVENSQRINVFNNPDPDPIYPLYSSTAQQTPGAFTEVSCASWNSSENAWETYPALETMWVGKDAGKSGENNNGIPLFIDRGDTYLAEMASMAFQDGGDLSNVIIIPIISEPNEEPVYDNDAVAPLSEFGLLPLNITNSIKLPEGLTAFPGITLCSPVNFANSSNTDHEYSGYPETWYDENGALNAWKVRVYLPSTITAFNIEDSGLGPSGSNAGSTFGIPEYLQYIHYEDNTSSLSNSTFKNLLRSENSSIEFYCFNHTEVPVITGSASAQETFSALPGVIKVFIPESLYNESLNTAGSWITYYPIETETITETTEHPSKVAQIVNETIGVDDLMTGEDGPGEPALSLTISFNPEISGEPSDRVSVSPANYLVYLNDPMATNPGPELESEYDYVWYLDGDPDNFDDNASPTPEEATAVLESLYEKPVTFVWDGQVIGSGVFGPESTGEDGHLTLRSDDFGLTVSSSYRLTVNFFTNSPETKFEGTHTFDIYYGIVKLGSGKKIQRKYLPDSEKIDELSDKVASLFDTTPYLSGLETLDFVFLEPSGLSDKTVIVYNDTALKILPERSGGATR